MSENSSLQWLCKKIFFCDEVRMVNYSKNLKTQICFQTIFLILDWMKLFFDIEYFTLH